MLLPTVTQQSLVGGAPSCTQSPDVTKMLVAFKDFCHQWIDVYNPMLGRNLVGSCSLSILLASRKSKEIGQQKHRFITLKTIRKIKITQHKCSRCENLLPSISTEPTPEPITLSAQSLWYPSHSHAVGCSWDPEVVCLAVVCRFLAGWLVAYFHASAVVLSWLFKHVSKKG